MRLSLKSIPSWPPIIGIAAPADQVVPPISGCWVLAAAELMIQPVAGLLLTLQDNGFHYTGILQGDPQSLKNIHSVIVRNIGKEKSVIDYLEVEIEMEQALHEFMRIARAYDVSKPRLEAAGEFLIFKVNAIVYLEERIRLRLEELSTVGIYRDVDIPFQKFRGGIDFGEWTPDLQLTILVDAFFFELVSIRDGLAQLLNISYKLGVSQDEGFVRGVQTKLSKIRTGFEEWFGPECPTWLKDLVKYRNHATHRQLLTLLNKLSTSLSVEDGTFDARRRITIQKLDGSQEHLLSFISVAGQRIRTLLTSSLISLAHARREWL
jgi:hypothetical protein